MVGAVHQWSEGSRMHCCCPNPLPGCGHEWMMCGRVTTPDCSMVYLLYMSSGLMAPRTVSCWSGWESIWLRSIGCSLKCLILARTKRTPLKIRWGDELPFLEIEDDSHNKVQNFISNLKKYKQ